VEVLRIWVKSVGNCIFLSPGQNGHREDERRQQETDAIRYDDGPFCLDDAEGQPQGEPQNSDGYIGAEMELVSRVLMIFQACGEKLVMEQTVAREPMSVTSCVKASLI
jgi:hypothetical protein